MLEEFRRGNTPNPDIMCNQEIKFKLFYEKAMAAGADFIATGHYARVKRFEHDFSGTGPSRPSSRGSGPHTSTPPESSTGRHLDPENELSGTRLLRWSAAASGLPREMCSQSLSTQLLRAVDENKDQTYFLYRISEEALAHTIFPIGEMTKPEVKKLAEKHGLHNAYKKESMGVCFVGEVGMRDFLKEYIEIEPGEIREMESEKVLGYHEGAVFYTIGQRHGLYLNGERGVVNDGMPYYVVAKDVKKNIVYVSKNLNDEHIWTKELGLKDVIIRQSECILSGTGPSRPSSRGSGPHTSAAASGLPREKHSQLPINTLVRLRHRAPLIPATFDGETLKFAQEIKRPANGQSAVIYDGKVCLGGGIITETN